METVAFYSYKGGVGRTLLVANTALFLSLSGRKVVALDLDLEAPGLHYKLASREVLASAKSGTLRGAVNALRDLLEGKSAEHKLQDSAIELDLPVESKGSLRLIPAGSAPSPAYWQALEELQSLSRSNSRSGGLAEAVLELQASIADEFAPDFLLIDSRTGITELGGLATSLLADRVVCLSTTAPESIEGARVVAEALRAAPRLASQDSLRIDFLITRVPAGFDRSTNWGDRFQDIGDSLTILPHDSAIAKEERVWSQWRAAGSSDSDGANNGNELFSATLDWIGRAFPGHQEDAQRAKRRLETVQRTWRELTRTTERVRGGSKGRRAWPLEQLRERELFKRGKHSRLADIAVYKNASDNAKPLMIIEYVEKEDRDETARWWLTAPGIPVVAIISDNSERRIYSRRNALETRMRHSDRRDLPLPHDFEALVDPTDTSVDALLDSLRRNRADYLDRIVTEWVRCSAAGLHGGAPWKPDLAKKIVDRLAAVEDVELARRVLWATSPDSFGRRMWLGDGDEWIDEQVYSELFSSLIWRLPAQAVMEVLKESSRMRGLHGRPAGLLSIGLLARDILGLRYDPDATFRVEGQRLLDRIGLDQSADREEGLYFLSPAFEHTEISFEISSDLPPVVVGHAKLRKKPLESMDLRELVAQTIATSSLVTTGLLGNYEANSGRVVLYREAIAHCAKQLGLCARLVESVTLIHETLHALSHLGRDLDGRMWTEFALPDAAHLLFEPSWFHETLTQYFTYQQLLRLDDAHLLHAFESLSDKQAPAYRNWRQIKDIPLEDARNWFLSVRRGIAPSGFPSQVMIKPTWD